MLLHVNVVTAVTFTITTLKLHLHVLQYYILKILQVVESFKSNVRQLVSYNMHNMKILLMNVMNSLLRSHPSTAHVFHFDFKAIKKINWQHAVYSF